MTPAAIKELSFFMEETAKRLEIIIELLEDSKMEMEDFAPWFEDEEAKKKKFYMHECTEAVDTFEGWQDCTEGRAQNLIDDGSLWEVVKNKSGGWIEKE